jgi:glycolate oxidase
VKDPLAPIRKSPRLQKFAEWSDFGATQRRATQSRLFWLLVRNAVNIQSAFRPSQGMATMMGAFDTWDLAHAQAEYAAEAKQKYIERGLIIADGGDLGAGGTFENGHLGYLEGIILYDPSNPASVEAVRDLVEGGLRASVDKALGVPIAGFGVRANKELGPHCYHYDRWVSRLKTALDPNTASDPFFYAEADEKE